MASEESFLETSFALTSKQGYDAKQSAQRVFTARIATRIANAWTIVRVIPRPEVVSALGVGRAPIARNPAMKDGTDWAAEKNVRRKWMVKKINIQDVNAWCHVCALSVTRHNTLNLHDFLTDQLYL